MLKVTLLIILSVMIFGAVKADTLSVINVRDTTITKIYQPTEVVKAEKRHIGNVIFGIAMITLGTFGSTITIIDASTIPKYYKYNPNLRTNTIYLTFNIMAITYGIWKICQ
jgi:hypothetical protein